MKKWFIVALMIVVSFGCKKPKSTPNPINPPDSSIAAGLSVLMNNTKWTATGYIAQANRGIMPDTTLNIEAYYNNGKQQYLHLTINNWPEKVGSYNYPYIGAGSKSYPSFYFESDPNSPVAQYYSVSGNVKITKISNNNIQGTFNAIMSSYHDTLSFTSGMFNIPYKPL